jgi:hypothetical protein
METEAERRARIIAEVEASLAEGLPEPSDAGWQYPPAPSLPEEASPSEPLFHRDDLVALRVIIGIALVIFACLIID